ncbi:unnamed protein product [Urochloa decumbens]|uniref:Uncharacterized protein n=1 Tax=Urochloa decumbens TaxID=240449 RepID=A0ABC9F831_9POAL
MVGVTTSALIGVLKPLLGKLSTLLGGQYGKLKGVHREISFLHDEMMAMNTALEVASHLEDPSTHMEEWICQVRELSYDVEDCIDVFMHHLAEDDDRGGIIRKTSRRLKALRARHRIAGQIAQLKERAVQVSDRRMRYGSDALTSSSNSASAIDPRLPALFEDANRLVAIDGPRNELVRWLTKDTDLVEQNRVVSIVGFGGLGKTTLANQIYQNIKSQYDCTAFVSVSRNPNINQTLTDLLWQVLDTSNPRSEHQKQRAIMEDLETKILGEYELINIVREYLQNKRTFHQKNDCPSVLEEVVDEILKKCGGLPLAIINIASLLASKPVTKQEWEKVHSSIGSALEHDQDLEVVKRILFLSYCDLPHQLKICLLYLSIFPEDFQINRERLIWRWIAEGFINKQRGKSLEETGERCFNELINRNMIQPMDIDYSGDDTGDIGLGQRPIVVLGHAEHGLTAALASVVQQAGTDEPMNAAADSEEPELGSPPGFSRITIPDEETDESRLSAFVKAVQHKIQSPLLTKPIKTKRVVPVLAAGELPKRSKRLANHPLANVASSKRAEVILMRRFEEIPEAAPLTMEAKQAYKKFYAEEMREKHYEAIQDLSCVLEKKKINISTKENFVTLVEGKDFSTSARTIRRLSLLGKCQDITWPGTSTLTHVRSLSVYGTFNQAPPLTRLQVLRVLDLQDLHDMDDNHIFVEDIGNLHQLRYLCLGKSNINMIPKQIGKLKLLQTLDLRACTKLKELPVNITELRQLVRLFVWSGVKFPKGIAKMKSLEELSKFDGSSNLADIVLELGELTGLKKLRVGWHPNGPIMDEVSYKQSMASALHKLGEHNLRSLRVDYYQNEFLSVDFLVDSWLPMPHRLECFEIFGPIYFTRTPLWMPTLSDLTCLSINIGQVEAQDVQLLKNIPALLFLYLYTKKPPQETLAIGRSGFRCLKEFIFFPYDKDGRGLKFEAGAMPKLQSLSFGFVARDDLCGGNGEFDFGIQHLACLKRIDVIAFCNGARAWEVVAAEAAIRSAAVALPNHPKLQMRRYFQDKMLKDETLRAK